MRWTQRGAAGAIGVALALGACGDDDATADRSRTTNGTSSAAFCAAALTLETAPGPDVDFAEATDEQIADAVEAWGDEVLGPLADEVVAVAPEEVGREIDVLSRVVDEIRSTGNIAAFDAPDARSANDAYMDFTAAECGWGTLEVAALDYGFEGVPSELDAGPTRFVLTNQGNELHELFIFRRNQGTEQPVDELLSLPDEQVSQLLTSAGEPAFAPPGGSEPVVLDLEPGSYIAVCFIPAGLASEDALAPPGAAPHAALGMVAEFVVRD